MMHNQKQLPVHSDYRQPTPLQAQWYYQNQIKSPFQQRWYSPYVLEEHVTTASQQNTFAYDPNRPHLNIKLEDNHLVRALVDTGSSVCLGDSSLLTHIKAQFIIGSLLSQ